MSGTSSRKTYLDLALLASLAHDLSIHHLLVLGRHNTRGLFQLLAYKVFEYDTGLIRRSTYDRGRLGIAIDCDI